MFQKGQVAGPHALPREAAPARAVFDLAAPLERVRGETNVANMALRDYAMLGPGRTLVRLMESYRKRYAAGFQPPSIQRATLGHWSGKFAWGARVERFDQLQSEKLLARWEKRFAQLREQEWRDAETLRATALDLLKEMPKFRKRQEKVTVDEEGNTLKVVTLALSVTLTDVVRALEEASALQRKAVDEPNEHIKLSGSALDKAIASELARLSYPGQAAISGPTAYDDAGFIEHRGSREPARNGGG